MPSPGSAGRPSTLPPCPSPWLARAGCGVSGGARRISRASGATASATIAANTSMVCAPAEQRDAALEHRRPDRAGDILAAGDQRQCRAAAAIEPAADIDVARGVDAAIAEQADEQPVADPQPPGAVAGGDHEADADHQPRRTPRSTSRRPARRCVPWRCRRMPSRARPASRPAPAPTARCPVRRRSASARPPRRTARHRRST